MDLYDLPRSKPRPGRLRRSEGVARLERIAPQPTHYVGPVQPIGRPAGSSSTFRITCRNLPCISGWWTGRLVLQDMRRDRPLDQARKGADHRSRMSPTRRALSRICFGTTSSLPAPASGRANALTVTQIVGAREDFFEKRGVQDRFLAFARDASLTRMLFQQAHRHSSKDGEVLRPVAAADSTPIFVKTHVQLPVQGVLDPPMVPQHFRVALGAELPAANEVPPLHSRLPVYLALAVTHPHRR